MQWCHCDEQDKLAQSEIGLFWVKLIYYAQVTDKSNKVGALQ